jgi:hypothetical protein
VRNLPNEQPALAFTRDQLDRLGVGKDLKEIPWGSKRFKLPPSKILHEKEWAVSQVGRRSWNQDIFQTPRDQDLNPVFGNGLTARIHYTSRVNWTFRWIAERYGSFYLFKVRSCSSSAWGGYNKNTHQGKASRLLLHLLICLYVVFNRVDTIDRLLSPCQVASK